MSTLVELLKPDLSFHAEKRTIPMSTMPFIVVKMPIWIGTDAYGSLGSFPIEVIIFGTSWKTSEQRSTMARRLFFIAVLESIVLLLFVSAR